VIETSGCELEEHKLVSDTHTFTYLLTDIQTDRQTVTLWRGWCSELTGVWNLSSKACVEFCTLQLWQSSDEGSSQGWLLSADTNSGSGEWVDNVNNADSQLIDGLLSGAEQSWAELSWLLSLRTDDFDMQNVCRPSVCPITC